jgi:release factor glutamine methyltransferase
MLERYNQGRMIFSHGGVALGPDAPLKDWQAGLTQAFAAAGVRTPQIDARLLLMGAIGLSHGQIIMNPMRPVTAEEAAAVTACGERRLAREPLSRILGYREFYGRRFGLTPAALDPRPDTETVVEAALAIVKSEGWEEAPIQILDLGVGSGAILLTLLAELPQASGLGVDVSPSALNNAQANAEKLEVSGRANFQRSDWLQGVAGSFHIVISNPPYIATPDLAGLAPEVSAYDPKIALDGGEDGLTAYRKIIPGLKSVLAPGGWAVLEVGQHQSSPVAQLLQINGFAMDDRDLCIKEDLYGIERAISGKA